HEMGIRMALGASRGDVIRLVLTSGGGIAAIGIGVGVAGALALSRLMSGLVYGVPALDPVTYLVVPAILAAAALLACWIPARRAAAPCGRDPPGCCMARGRGRTLAGGRGARSCPARRFLQSGVNRAVIPAVGRDLPGPSCSRTRRGDPPHPAAASPSHAKPGSTRTVVPVPCGSTS